MSITKAAQANHDELFPGHRSTLQVTDPEFVELFDNFAFDEVIAHGNPLEGQSTTTAETRHRDGLAVQKSIFGDRIDAMYASSPPDQRHIQRYLSANCFGDYYTRTGLDIPTRELLTFAVITQLLPYIGYPRALNAIGCLNEVISESSAPAGG